MIENYSKFEVRAVVRFLQAEGVSERNSSKVRECTRSESFKPKNVSVWCKKFEDGRTALNDDPEKNSGRPRTSHTDENCAIV
jgi:hypothetical protein